MIEFDLPDCWRLCSESESVIYYPPANSRRPDQMPKCAFER
jgi:hypothetical protein